MMGFELVLAVLSVLPLHSAFGFSGEEKFPERNGIGRFPSADLNLPRFRRTYKNSNEFRYRKSGRYPHYFPHEVERTPMDFTGHDPLRFHVEANYDDPVWPNTINLFLNSNRGNRRWHPRRVGFRRRISREAEQQKIERHQPIAKMFPRKHEKNVADKMRMELKHKRNKKIQDSPRKDFNVDVSAKHKDIHYKNINKNNDVLNDVAASYKHSSHYQQNEFQEHSVHIPNKIHTKQQRWFGPAKFNRPTLEDDIEEDYPPQALVAFMNRHKLSGITNWRKDSDPHQGLKNVKIVRPHGNIRHS